MSYSHQAVTTKKKQQKKTYSDLFKILLSRIPYFVYFWNSDIFDEKENLLIFSCKIKFNENGEGWIYLIYCSKLYGYFFNIKCEFVCQHGSFTDEEEEKEKERKCKGQQKRGKRLRKNKRKKNILLRIRTKNKSKTKDKEKVDT